MASEALSVFTSPLVSVRSPSRRLIQHHASVIQPQLHALVLAAVPAIEALRSLTAKTAIILFEELFCSLGRSADPEVDTIVPCLLKRSGEQSVAGRDNFMSQMADSALQAMAESVSEPRAALALLANIGHKNAPVRAKVACHLDCLLDRRGANMVGARDLLEKILVGVSVRERSRLSFLGPVLSGLPSSCPLGRRSSCCVGRCCFLLGREWAS